MSGRDQGKVKSLSGESLVMEKEAETQSSNPDRKINIIGQGITAADTYG